MKQLVIFDIDGTLTDTNTVDGDCFRIACKKMGIENPSVVWSDYKFSTDSGIFQELYERHHQRSPDQNEVEEFCSTFVTELQNSLSRDVGLCRPVLGVVEFLSVLKSDPQVSIAVATGAWRPSAEVKLKSADLFENDRPMATAHDHFDRSEILKIAKQRSEAAYGERFEKVTYIGDGIWDWRASQSCGFRFIGRSDRGSLKGKIPDGQLIIDDYLSIDKILSHLKNN